MREAYLRAYTAREIWFRYYPPAQTILDAQWAVRDFENGERNARRLADYEAKRITLEYGK